MTATRTPKESVETLYELGAEILQKVIAIDSQSDEDSESMPSTEGQRRMSEALVEYFSGLGLETTSDEYANLLAELPGNAGANRPKLAFMVHMDTSKGTRAVPSLSRLPRWDGGPIPYPENPKLQVSVALYPETRVFLEQDLLFGPGQRAFGLDDKLGMTEMMLFTWLLTQNPDIVRPDIVLVARPDEEIGRMAAVEGLAAELGRRGVTHGYTVDGLDPFEINTENFNAAQARVRFAGRPLSLPEGSVARRLTLAVSGAKSHGATAKAEGYLNATTVFLQVLSELGELGRQVFPVAFASDATAEVDARLSFVVCGADAAAVKGTRDVLVARFAEVLAPHEYKGAGVVVTEDVAVDVTSEHFTDEVMQLYRQLERFRDTPGPQPVLSEHSAGYEGYTNPYFVEQGGGSLELRYRIRDFSPEGLAQRKAHVREVCGHGSAVELSPALSPELSPELSPAFSIDDQYINMGPALEPYPELVSWAERAADAAGVVARRGPIRGGTGVDPFLVANIPIANLGTGYFAPESEKEFTSRQMIARHALWLCHLVQIVAQHEQAG